MTLLMPILMGAVFLLPAYFATVEDNESRTVAVYDASSIFLGRLEGNEFTIFHFVPEADYLKIKQDIKNSGFYALLVIPPNFLNTNTVQIFSDSNIPYDLKSAISDKLKAIAEKDKMAGVMAQVAVPDLEQRINSTKVNVNVETIKMGQGGSVEKSSTELGMVLGYIFGFIMYMFIILYGVMVMHGVMEEKQSRIVEVIISSVKPFQLMMGKIIGIALVGLTQIAIWIVLGFMILSMAKGMIGNPTAAQQAQSVMEQSDATAQQMAQSGKMQDILASIDTVNLPLIIGCFIFFFIAGYLLYSAMFAAVGSAVDAPEDAQQFSLPVMIPVILSIIVLMSAIRNPEGPIAFWFSIIPLTSPIVMVARIPFGVPTWELLLSMFLLVGSFIGMVWLSGKIYRTGILMYGKKSSWKELAKWVRYRG
jgi:ABC-2 type transport system permease protein